ncbi:MAG: protease inhibitor I42 family protein [Candidatus Eiseniibacteriota bacterium]
MFSVFSLVPGLAGCQPSGDSDLGAKGSAQVETIHYAGTLPCADCEGIRTELVLRREGPGERATTYELSEMFLGRSNEFQKQNGTWTDERGSGNDPEAVVYRLIEAKRSFLRAGSWALRSLDGSGSIVRSPDNYTLVRVDLSPVGNPLSVTEKESGKMIRLAVGQELIAQLAANHTTGYGWTLGDTMSGAIALPDPPTYAMNAPSATTDATGAPRATGVAGEETWRFVGIEPGTQSLQFAYRRSWEKSVAAARSVRFTVTVE